MGRKRASDPFETKRAPMFDRFRLRPLRPPHGPYLPCVAVLRVAVCVWRFGLVNLIAHEATRMKIRMHVLCMSWTMAVERKRNQSNRTKRRCESPMGVLSG